MENKTDQEVIDKHVKAVFQALGSEQPLTFNPNLMVESLSWLMGVELVLYLPKNGIVVGHHAVGLLEQAVGPMFKITDVDAENASADEYFEDVGGYETFRLDIKDPDAELTIQQKTALATGVDLGVSLWHRGRGEL